MMSPVPRSVLLGLLALSLIACKGRDEAKSLQGAKSEARESLGGDADDVVSRNAASAPAAEPELAKSKKRDKAPGRARGGKGSSGKVGAKAPADDAESSLEEEDQGGNAETGARSRSWFPETFLFEPLIVTDDQGAASVDVTVPDRLTSWRVLALAHSRSGSQAGAVTEFLGTLPAYVDPILPPRLRVGDRIRIPVQLVNTTSDVLRTELTMSASGGTLEAPPKSVSVPARGSTVLYAQVRVEEPGELRLVASLGGTDSVVRTAEVVPVGKRIDVGKSATLAAPRTFSLAAPESERIADRVRLEVFPGALAILRSELGASSSRGGVAADAFTLLLAGQAPGLLAKLGDEPNTDALRTMTILATQRVVRHARVMTPDTATLLAQAALAHPQNSILEALGKRAVATLETTQLPDGTCGGENGWTLQRLLVATADCARAAIGARNVVARASGAFERHGKQINDPYTAAAILAADGAPDQVFAKKLGELLVKSIKRSDAGAAWIKLPDGVVRADGSRPSTVEASAMAALALVKIGGDKNLIADLGATVLAGYSRRRGWGDGRANLVATEALMKVFDAPIPANVSIELLKDGKSVVKGQLDAKNVRDVLTLEARNVGASGRHEWTVVAEPAVPGLGFNLEASTWVPWPPQERNKGLELAAKPPESLVVGQMSGWRIDATAPAGTRFSVHLALPAGVQFDRASLDALTATATLTHYELDDEQLTLHVAPLSPGQAFGAELRVIPTVAGSIQSGPQSIRMSGTEVNAPPSAWLIK